MLSPAPVGVVSEDNTKLREINHHKTCDNAKGIHILP